MYIQYIINLPDKIKTNFFKFPAKSFFDKIQCFTNFNLRIARKTFKLLFASCILSNFKKEMKK